MLTRTAFLFVLLGVTACGQQAPAMKPGEIPAEAPAPDETAERPARLDFVVRRATGDDPHLTVEIRLKGSPSGVTQIGNALAYGPAAGLNKVIETHAASTAEGDPLEVTDITIDGRRFYFEVRHEPAAEIRVRYRVGPELTPVRDSTAGLYRPYLDDRLMHVLGHTVFLSAPHQGRLVEGTIEFVGFDEPQWRVWSTLPGDGGTFEFQGSVGRGLRASVFVAGPDVTVRTVSGGEHDLQVAMIDTALDPDRLANTVGDLVTWQRKFFGDQDYPSFLVTVLGGSPRIARDYDFQSVNGTGLKSGFASYVGPKITFADDEKSDELVALLAHELLHIWFSASIFASGRRGESSWFWEGFTTYYTAESLHRAGVTDKEAYVDRVNDYVRGYLENVYRLASNEEAARHTWTNRHAHDLAYERGAVLAAVLDYELRTTTKYTLDDFVYAMAKHAKASGPLTQQQLFAMVETWTTPQFARWYEERAIDGKDIDIPDDLLGPDYVLRRHKGALQFLRRDQQ